MSGDFKSTKEFLAWCRVAYAPCPVTPIIATGYGMSWDYHPTINDLFPRDLVAPLLHRPVTVDWGTTNWDW